MWLNCKRFQMWHSISSPLCSPSVRFELWSCQRSAWQNKTNGDCTRAKGDRERSIINSCHQSGECPSFGMCRSWREKCIFNLEQWMSVTHRFHQTHDSCAQWLVTHIWRIGAASKWGGKSPIVAQGNWMRNKLMPSRGGGGGGGGDLWTAMGGIVLCQDRCVKQLTRRTSNITYMWHWYHRWCATWLSVRDQGFPADHRSLKGPVCCRRVIETRIQLLTVGSLCPANSRRV